MLSKVSKESGSYDLVSVGYKAKIDWISLKTGTYKRFFIRAYTFTHFSYICTFTFVLNHEYLMRNTTILFIECMAKTKRYAGEVRSY